MFANFMKETKLAIIMELEDFKSFKKILNKDNRKRLYGGRSLTYQVTYIYSRLDTGESDDDVD